MAVRKSKEETYSVKGSIEEVLKKCKAALNNGEFTNVSSNTLINQLTGNYKKFTVWGEIMITLTPQDDRVTIHIVSTANTDNIFALFSSPNQKIIDQFKNHL